MGRILFLVLTASLTCKVLTEDSGYTKFPSEDGKFLVQYDNQNANKRPEKVVVKLSSTNKQDYYDQEHYNQENPSQKSRYDNDRDQEEKYVYQYPKDQHHSKEKQYPYKQDVEEKVEKIAEKVFVNVNVKKGEQTYPEQKKINVNVKINNEKQDEYNNQDKQYVSKLLTNYEEQPKKVLVNVNIRKENIDYYDQGKYGPKKININVKISKVQEPKVYKEKEVRRESVLDKLYRVSKKYTGL